MKNTITFICLSFSLFTLAQSKGKIGGVLGLNFGSQTNIQISPEYAYPVHKNIDVGVLANYQFVKQNNIKQNIYGGGAFIRGFLNQNIFGSLTYNYNYLKSNSGYKNDFNSLWIGAGYRQQIGNNVYARAGLQYDILYKKENSLYGTSLLPIFGISVGL